MKKPKSDYSIQAVSNALHLLEAFYGADDLGVTELSHFLGLHKNNVFRLLATLEQHGYVEQTAQTERYRLGVRCLELGRAFLGSDGFLRHARIALEALVDNVQETAHVAVLRDFEVVHLDGMQPQQHMIVNASRVGLRLPAHACALGKVLLGCGSATARETYDRKRLKRGLSAFTPNTIVDRDKLLEHLHTVGAQGYALDLEELETGMNCAAAPIYDASGGLVAALSLSGPAFRLTREKIVSEVLPELAAVATKVSRQLGFTV